MRFSSNFDLRLFTLNLSGNNQEPDPIWSNSIKVSQLVQMSHPYWKTQEKCLRGVQRKRRLIIIFKKI